MEAIGKGNCWCSAPESASTLSRRGWASILCAVKRAETSVRYMFTFRGSVIVTAALIRSGARHVEPSGGRPKVFERLLEILNDFADWLGLRAHMLLSRSPRVKIVTG